MHYIWTIPFLCLHVLFALMLATTTTTTMLAVFLFCLNYFFLKPMLPVFVAENKRRKCETNISTISVDLMIVTKVAFVIIRCFWNSFCSFAQCTACFNTYSNDNDCYDVLLLLAGVAFIHHVEKESVWCCYYLHFLVTSISNEMKWNVYDDKNARTPLCARWQYAPKNVFPAQCNGMFVHNEQYLQSFVTFGARQVTSCLLFPMAISHIFILSFFRRTKQR